MSRFVWGWKETPGTNCIDLRALPDARTMVSGQLNACLITEERSKDSRICSPGSLWSRALGFTFKTLDLRMASKDAPKKQILLEDQETPRTMWESDFWELTAERQTVTSFSGSLLPMPCMDSSCPHFPPKLRRACRKARHLKVRR